MADTAIKPALKAAPDADPDGGDGGGDPWGRALNVAGICAAVVLGVIIFDVISGGKVTRLLTRGKRGGCEGCGDEQGPAGDS